MQKQATKKKPGRPRKDATANEHLTFYLTPEEKKSMSEYAASKGMTLSGLIRWLLKGAHII